MTRVAFDPQLRLGSTPILDVELNTGCRDEIIPILRALQHIYSKPSLRDAVLREVGNDVNATTSPKLGREGLSYWEILVLAAVRLGCNLDYDKLQDLAENHRNLRAVIGLDDGAVAQLCASVAADDAVVVANFNAPGQVVVSGEAAAVDAFAAAASEAGAKRVVPLPVSGAFHSRLMRPAAEAMMPLLREADIKSSRIPVITNVQAAPVTDGEELREQLIRQMTHPVRWAESVRAISEIGVSTAVEVGPGAVLKGLARRLERALSVLTAGTVEEVTSVVSTLRETVASE